MSGLLLPPLMVLCFGSFLAMLLFGSTTLAESAQSGTQIPVLSLQIVPTTPQGPLSPVFTPEVQYWAEQILGWAAQAGLDPDLAATVMQIESCGDPRALSSAGALGLFQVMPYHFTESDDPYYPDTNALRGLDYLRRSLETSAGNARLALAGYNGGIGVIGWPESEWSLQTRRYAAWGSGIYADATNGLQESPQLQDWLNSNGLSLCRQASERLGLTP